jgi:UPF0176 protein
MALHNRISGKELKEKLAKDNQDRTTISFYQYYQVSSPENFRDELYKKLKK